MKYILFKHETCDADIIGDDDIQYIYIYWHYGIRYPNYLCKSTIIIIVKITIFLPMIRFSQLSPWCEISNFDSECTCTYVNLKIKTWILLAGSKQETAQVFDGDNQQIREDLCRPGVMGVYYIMIIHKLLRIRVLIDQIIYIRCCHIILWCPLN